MAGEFADKVVWVVGASGGLGSATARAFIAAGAKVAVSGRSLAKLREALDGSDQSRALLLPIDITKEREVKQAANEIISRFGRLDVLVNSTSVSTFGDFLTLTDAMWQEVYEAKLFAYARTMRAAIPQMLLQQSGAIVNISGSGGKYPNFPSHVAGSSGNAAVNLATKAVGDLYAARGVRANCVAPGPIRSPRLDSIAAANEALSQRVPGQWSASASGEGVRPPGEARDIADAVLFLASDRARHINGIVLTVDGGATPTT